MVYALFVCCDKDELSVTVFHMPPGEALLVVSFPGSVPRGNPFSESVPQENH